MFSWCAKHVPTFIHFLSSKHVANVYIVFGVIYIVNVIQFLVV